MAPRRPPSQPPPSRMVVMLCSAMQDMLRDCLREAKTPTAKAKIRLRMKLERDWYLKQRIPDAATARRAGYTRADLPPWAPLKLRLKCKASPLLYPALQ